MPMSAVLENTAKTKTQKQWLAGLVTSRGSSEFSRAGCLASIVGAAVLIFAGRMLGLT